MRSQALFVSLFSLAACGHGSAAPTKAGESAGPPAPAPHRVVASRELSRSASFAELVALLEQEDALPSAPASCLLGENGTGYVFAGEASVSLHPLPAPADELDGVLAQARGVRVLTRLGSYGPSDATLGLVALTEVSPTREALVLAVTDRGYYVRELAHADSTATPRDQLLATLTSRGAERAVYVVSEGHVSLTRLYDVLSLIAAHPGPVVLAMALPPDVVLPATPKPSDGSARCPDGLPATDTLEGDLAMDALLEGIAPLREHGGECLSRADGPGRAGGRLTLALRIDASGRVSDTCLVASDVDDAELARCVLASARELRFAKPSPAGVVDAQLPLVLRPDVRPPQRAVCDGAVPH